MGWEDKKRRRGGKGRGVRKEGVERKMGGGDNRGRGRVIK